jgi:protein-disulfide isomerase
MPITRRTILPVVGVAVVAASGAVAGWRLLGRSHAAQAATATPVPATIAAATPASQAAPSPAGPQFTARTLGLNTAPVKVHEFFSLTCTHCAHFGNATMPEVKQNLVDTGKVQFIYHDFPLDQVALKGSQVARYLPAAEYFPFVEALFASQNDWAFQPGEDYHASIFKYAALAGMDQPTYEAAWNDDALGQFILNGQKEDEAMYKIEATPTFIINGKTFPGALEYDDFAAKVAAAAGG